MWLLVSVSSTRIDHDARGLTARGALFAAKRVSFFWAVVSQLSRGLLEGVRPYRLVGGVVTLAALRRAAECGRGNYQLGTASRAHLTLMHIKIA